MSENSYIRILSVDDHPFLREGIATVINSQPDMRIIAQASNGEEGINSYRECRPDVTLMDVRLPGMSGIEALTIIRNEFPEARVIMLSTFQGDIEIRNSLANGARAYLLKSMVPDELLDVIRTVHAGKKYIPPQVASELAQHLTDENLTTREIEILELVSKGSGNKEIANQLFISEQTVKAHLRHIMEKLQAKDRTEAVAIAVRRGIMQL